MASESRKAENICVDYFKTLDKNKLTEREYWDFFRKYIKDVDDETAVYVYKHRADFIAALGEKEVNKKYIRCTIQVHTVIGKRKRDKVLLMRKDLRNMSND